MKLLIFGGSGFIGKNLIKILSNQGYELILFTRNPANLKIPTESITHNVLWDAETEQPIIEHCHGAYGILNLAGESIGNKLWTKKHKKLILSSRTKITRIISSAIKKSKDKPLLIIQGSAVGYYGSRAGLIINEQTGKGQGYLSDVVESWENSLEIKGPDTTRVMFIRTGVVLGSDGGIMPLFSLPFKFFIGGHPGDGTQWFPWIHISDVASAIAFLLKKTDSSGIYNLASPEPVQMKHLSKVIAKVTSKPSWLNIPSFILKLLPGGMAEDLLLTSQRVVPYRLMEAGYKFHFTNIEEALNDLLIKQK